MFVARVILDGFVLQERDKCPNMSDLFRGTVNDGQRTRTLKHLIGRPLVSEMTYCRLE